MILLLTCDCPSAEPLVRKALQEAGIKEWLATSIHKGREHCLTILERFPKPYHELLAFRALFDYLDSRASSFNVIVGYDDETFYWADIHSGAPMDWMDGQAILKRFA